jgi:hypothetical protein
MEVQSSNGCQKLRRHLLLGFWWAIRSARREDKPSFFVSIAFLVFVIFNGIPAP